MGQCLTEYMADKTNGLPMDLGLEGIVVLDKDCSVLYKKRWVDDYPRDIYSNTKSFTSAAIGMAIHEGYLDLKDKPTDFFGDNHRTYDGSWEKMTLSDLLTMRSGILGPQLMYFDRRAGIGARDYVAHMMSQVMAFAPGEKYAYSTGDSILAGCMLEKACRTSLLSFLYDRYFEPMGIEYPIWETDLCGHTCGGSGLCLRLVDMAKLGVLYLNKGVAGGRRLFSASWAQESFHAHVQTNNSFFSWTYGYYWKGSKDSRVVRASGSFGQDTLVFPSLGLVLGMQCRPGTNASHCMYGIIKDYLDNL